MAARVRVVLTVTHPDEGTVTGAKIQRNWWNFEIPWWNNCGGRWTVSDGQRHKNNTQVTVCHSLAFFVSAGVTVIEDKLQHGVPEITSHWMSTERKCLRRF